MAMTQEQSQKQGEGCADQYLSQFLFQIHTYFSAGFSWLLFGFFFYGLTQACTFFAYFTIFAMTLSLDD